MERNMLRFRSIRAFTLVEILIVVVILGILAAIVTPQLMSATDDAALAATQTELEKLRRHVAVYQARNQQALPNVVAGDGTWGELIGPESLMAPPVNSWVGGVRSRVIMLGNAPDVGYHQNYGWIFDPATGSVWAAGFDGNDEPFIRN